MFNYCRFGEKHMVDEKDSNFPHQDPQPPIYGDTLSSNKGQHSQYPTVAGVLLSGTISFEVDVNIYVLMQFLINYFIFVVLFNLNFVIL